MTKKELATKKHESGFSCCQAVACSFAEEVGVPEEVLFKAAEGFGLGMGTTKQTCGAMTGAILLAGFKNSTAELTNPTSKPGTMKLSKAIGAAFESKVGATLCCQIKGVDTGKVLCSCPDCINYGVEVVEEVLGL